MAAPLVFASTYISGYVNLDGGSYCNCYGSYAPTYIQPYYSSYSDYYYGYPSNYYNNYSYGYNYPYDSSFWRTGPRVRLANPPPAKPVKTQPIVGNGLLSPSKPAYVPRPVISGNGFLSAPQH